MPEITPELRTYTHTITAPTADRLNAQLDQFLKDMEKRTDIEYTILEIIPAIVVSFQQRDIDAS